MAQKEESRTELEKVGNRLRELRIQKGYTNYEYFAFENGISRTQYGRYEKGQDLRMSTFFKVIEALGVTPVEFFEDL